MSKVTYKLRTETAVNWEKDGAVTGRILLKDIQPIEDKDGKRDLAYLLIDTGSRYVRVYESAALQELFADAEPGDFTHIESLGLAPTKEKGRTVRRFDCQLWTDADAAPLPKTIQRSQRVLPGAEESTSGKARKRGKA